MPRLLSAVALAALAVCLPGARAQVPAVVEEIRREAIKDSDDAGGRPLPLAAHWQQGLTTGTTGPTYNSFVQRDLIAAGHHLLPNVPMPEDAGVRVSSGYASYESLIRQYAAWDMPMTVRGTNFHNKWANTTDLGMKNLPASDSPFVIRPSDGTINTAYIDPLGPIERWQEGGAWLVNSQSMRDIQEWHPNPSRVLFLANNETLYLKGQDSWGESRRYRNQFGTTNDDFMNHVTGSGYEERFRTMVESMKDGLTKPAWQDNSVMVAYNNFGPSHYGRWDSWQYYSNAGEAITKNDRAGNPVQFDSAIDYPHGWDGSSPSYYTSDTLAITDYQVYSIQVESQNWVPMLKQVYQENPKFWFELSVWDGTRYTKNADGTFTFTNKGATYESRGQTYSPERYKGMVQFGMWTTTPRVVREFRGWTEKWQVDMPQYFEAVMDSVDVLYEQPILEKFWRKGELVANPRQEHPYRVNTLPDFPNDERWFILDADVNPTSLLWGSNSGATEIKVFSLARVLGEEGSREWLLYAHSPLMDRPGVHITIPGFDPLIPVDVPVAGGFWHIEEATGRVLDMQTGLVSYVPEPTSMAVVFVGAAGLLGRVRSGSGHQVRRSEMAN